MWWVYFHTQPSALSINKRRTSPYTGIKQDVNWNYGRQWFEMPMRLIITNLWTNEKGKEKKKQSTLSAFQRVGNP